MTTSCRSYASRQGRITRAQRRTLASPNHYCLIDPVSAPINWEESFGRKAVGKKIVEIGFGNGVGLAEAADARPNDLFIGIEVYLSGIASLMMAIEKKEINNIQILKADASNAMETWFRPNSLDEIWIFFPDPWPKKRHHKRRLLTASFMEILLTRLTKDGLLHIVTDWQDYADSILATLQGCSGYRNLYEGFAPAPANHRFVTKFEQRAQQTQSTIFEMLFAKK